MTSKRNRRVRNRRVAARGQGSYASVAGKMSRTTVRRLLRRGK